MSSGDELRQMREYMGLSQGALADVLGFGKRGHDTVRSWEQGKRDGKSFEATPLATLAIRLLYAIDRATSHMDDQLYEAARDVLQNALPEMMR